MKGTRSGWGLLLFLLAVLAGYVFLRSSFFQVDQVVVTGNQQVTTDEIMTLVGSVARQNIWEVDTGELEARLRRVPLVAAAYVDRRLPGTIAVQVTERQEAAVVPFDQEYLAVDISGVMLGSYSSLDGIKVPLLTGLRLEGEPRAGRVLPCVQLPRVLPVLEAVQAQAPEMIGEIAVRPEGIDMYTIEGVRVKIGDVGNLQQKLDLLTEIYQENLETGEIWSLEYIDLRYPAAPVLKYRAPAPAEVGD